MATSDSMVYVVDDDAHVREGLDNLLQSTGYTTRCFAAVDEFVSYEREDRPSCLILDVRMPGTTGLDLQGILRASHDDLPIIFLTGHGDVPMSVKAIKAGAIEFLLKPFREDDLLGAVDAGLRKDNERRRTSGCASDLLKMFDTLSGRELQVLEYVARGCSNKDIARSLGLKEITIKVHRAKAMKKLKAQSLADFLEKFSRRNLIKKALHKA